jgi:glycosyltransferase involved in cell wall biosynthesis
LRAEYRALARRAALLLPVAPWSRDYFSKALDLDHAAFDILPVITLADNVIPPNFSGQPRLITVFAFDSWKRKGFDLMVQGIASVSRDIGTIRLDVYGRGSAGALLAMTALIRDARMESRINVMSALDHGTVQQVMNGYAGLALPSRHRNLRHGVRRGAPFRRYRSYGPGSGTRWLLSTKPTSAIAAIRRSVADVAKGIRHLVTDEALLKQRIGAMQTQGTFEILRRDAIGAKYCELLARAMRSGVQAADAA